MRGSFLSLKGPGGALFVLLCHARIPSAKSEFATLIGEFFEQIGAKC